ncbi:MAG TPA: response regulator [Planctomycetota bacterium]|nr:response regulator [Planctomycetota bacterium]
MIVPATDSSRSNGPGRLVLVAERDSATRSLESHFLAASGVSVQCVADGQAALELAKSARPEIVITEILIPRIDGLALCRRLKADAETSDTRVLVVSVLAAAVRAREAGADGFLLKPISEDRLVATVKNLLSQEGSRDEARDV